MSIPPRPPERGQPIGRRHREVQESSNGYIEDASTAGLWVLLFGFFCLAVKGAWTHAIVGVILAVYTVGISWLVYPFVAGGIMRSHYLKNGWIEV